MLRKMKRFEYFEPSTLEEAFSLLNKYNGKVKILSGGTDLLVAMKERGLAPSYVMNVKCIPGLDYIKYEEKKDLRIGALTTIRTIETSNVIREKFSVLAQAASMLGSIQVRNRATIGGNLCNAAPSAETAPSLIGLKAKVKIASLEGERIVPLEKFFVGPGITVLKKGEILAEIIVPFPLPHTKGIYIKYGRRKAMEIAMVSVAVIATLSVEGEVWEDVNIILGAVAPTPLRARKAEEVLQSKRISEPLIEKVGQLAYEEACPISDMRASADYRKEMVKVLVKKAIREISGLKKS